MPRQLVDNLSYTSVDLVEVSTTIRVSTRTRDRIASIAHASGEPMTAVVDEALDALERRRFFEDFNARYEELREDAPTWGEVESERAVESGSLRDASA